MDKLIKLLNEHGEYRRYIDDEFGICIAWADNYENRDYVDLEIISKKFGFIKWLVENDKIDTDIVYRMGFLCKTYDKDEVGEYFEPYEEILMLLSIQENPIEFLVSILK